MSGIIEVNGCDYIGKTTRIMSLQDKGFVLAPRITDLAEWGSLSEKERVQVYESLTPQEYAKYFSKMHAKKNNIILAGRGSQAIDRGFRTVLSDFGARFLLKGQTLNEAKRKVWGIALANGFREIGTIAINLDLEGSVEELMGTLEKRKLKREGSFLSDFEREYLPRMILFYRHIKNGV